MFICACASLCFSGRMYEGVPLLCIPLLLLQLYALTTIAIQQWLLHVVPGCTFHVVLSVTCNMLHGITVD